MKFFGALFVLGLVTITGCGKDKDTPSSPPSPDRSITPASADLFYGSWSTGKKSGLYGTSSRTVSATIKVSHSLKLGATTLEIKKTCEHESSIAKQVGDIKVEAVVTVPIEFQPVKNDGGRKLKLIIKDEGSGASTLLYRQEGLDSAGNTVFDFPEVPCKVVVRKSSVILELDEKSNTMTLSTPFDGYVDSFNREN